MGAGERDVADEAPDGPAAATSAVGVVVALLDLLRQRLRGAERSQQFHEPHRVLREQPADHGCRRLPDHCGQFCHLGESRVEVDQPLDVGWTADCQARADRAAPVVHHQGKPADAQLLEEFLEVVDAVGRPEIHIRGLIREATADMIGHDHPEVVP